MTETVSFICCFEIVYWILFVICGLYIVILKNLSTLYLLLATLFMGRYPSGQRGQTVNLLALAFGGSNPPLPMFYE